MEKERDRKRPPLGDMFDNWEEEVEKEDVLLSALDDWEDEVFY